MKHTIHVLTGSFGSLENAQAYTQRQWPEEPPEDAPEAARLEWENNGPTWPLADELNIYLDEDFIETIFGPGRLEYLETMLHNPADIEIIKFQMRDGDDTLVLIFSLALDGFEAEVKATERLGYCGEYVSVLGSSTL